MSKTTRIISFLLMVIPSLMLVMSAVMKLIHAPAVVAGFAKSALISHITLLGVIELVSVALFLIPKTTKVGFLLLCSYLGGAISIELAGGEPPVAAVFLALIWASVYLRSRATFVTASREPAAIER